MSNQTMSNQQHNLYIKKVGERIKQARQEIGYSQKELADALELSDKTVSAYEVGRAQPSLSMLRYLSRVTRRPIGYFLDETEHAQIDLRLKMKKIEQELLEVKRAIKK